MKIKEFLGRVVQKHGRKDDLEIESSPRQRNKSLERGPKEAMLVPKTRFFAKDLVE